MKLKSILALGLGVWFLNIGAAAHDQKIEIINNYTKEVQLMVGRNARGGLEYTYPKIVSGGRHVIEDASEVGELKVRDTVDWLGYSSINEKYTLIDITDLNRYVNGVLFVSIGAGLVGWGTWDIKTDWVPFSEGAAIEDLPWLGDEEPGEEAQEPQAEPAFEVPLRGTPYEILGVAEGASARQIRVAYMQLARQYHPDRGGGLDAEEAFKRVSSAHAILTDADKLAIYNQHKDAGHKPDEFRLLWPAAYWPDE